MSELYEDGADREPQFLFQAAVGRSGSTILRTSIGMHPDVYYNGFENNLIQDIVEVAHRNSTMPSRKFSMNVELPVFDAAFRQLIQKIVWPKNASSQHKIYFAAINPTKTVLDYLCQLYPNAKFVCLIRNGIEVVCSRMRFQSFAAQEFQRHCDVWNRCQDMVDWGKANPGRFRLFRHEWMYDPAMVSSKLSDLFDFVGLESCDDVVSNILNVSVCKPTTVAPKPFGKMTVGEKRDYFKAKANGANQWSEEQKRMFRDTCGGLMNQLGYPLPE